MFNLTVINNLKLNDERGTLIKTRTMTKKQFKDLYRHMRMNVQIECFVPTFEVSLTHDMSELRTIVLNNAKINF